MENVILFGASKMGIMAYDFLKEKDICSAIYFCDNDCRKWGTELKGIKIISPELLNNGQEKYTVIITSCHFIEISNQLKKMGYRKFYIFDEKKFIYEYLVQENNYYSILKDFLVIPKNKFILNKRDDICYDCFTEVAVDNKKQSLNEFYSNSDTVKKINESRVELFTEVLSKIEHELIDGKMIDVGCGTGEFLSIVKRNTNLTDLYGIDFSEEAINYCKKNIEGVNFNVCNIYKLNQSINQEFENVICMEVLEHLQHYDEILTNLFKIVSNNGRLIITIPNGEVDKCLSHINFWSKDDFSKIILKNLGDVKYNFYTFLKGWGMIFIIYK